MPSTLFKVLVFVAILLVIGAATVLALNFPFYAEFIVQVAGTAVLAFTLLILVFDHIQSRDPVVSFTITPRPDEGPEMKTFVEMKNHSKYDTAVWVNLNLKVNGVAYKVGSPKYTGEEPWNLQAAQVVSGTRFEPGEAIKSQVGMDVPTIQALVAQGKQEQPEITMDIRICCSASFWRRIRKPPQKWHFDFRRYKWVFDV